jgi:glucose-6-phosphate isomerase
MPRIELDYSYVLDFAKESELFAYQSKVNEIHDRIEQRSGAGKEFLGWLDWPYRISSEEIQRVKQIAMQVRNGADAFVVIGIGGSYLGARSVIEALCHSFAHEISSQKPFIYYAGQNMSGKYLSDLSDALKGKKVMLNVISKSGTTTEPALAFRFIKNLIERIAPGTDLKKSIIATTDARKGSLKTLADQEGYPTFVIPDDIGGRFSVLTPVGLLPIAAAGISIEELLRGAKDMAQLLKTPDLTANPAYFYAVTRNYMYQNGKAVELLSNFEPSLHYIAEWWKQLYGESEGKAHKSLFTASVDFSTDLHSMGQWIQEGVRNIFETFLVIQNQLSGIEIPGLPEDIDGFNFLNGKPYDFVNKTAYSGVALAHKEGQVPNMTIRIPELNAYYIGQLIYFFEKACAMSGYLLDVNPFDQPGVEAYKSNMFALLGKKGYEKKNQELQAVLSRTQKKVI